jgi:hypothetical protein
MLRRDSLACTPTDLSTNTSDATLPYQSFFPYTLHQVAIQQYHHQRTSCPYCAGTDVTLATTGHHIHHGQQRAFHAVAGIQRVHA